MKRVPKGPYSVKQDPDEYPGWWIMRGKRLFEWTRWGDNAIRIAGQLNAAWRAGYRAHRAAQRGRGKAR